MMKAKYSNKENNEKKHFDNMADKYDQNYGYFDEFTKYKISKKTNLFINLIRKNFKRKKISLLELGCGTGVYTELVANSDRKSTILALDVSPKMVKIARDKCKRNRNVKFINRSAYSTGLKNKSVDVIFGFYVLHHLDIDRVRDEMVRILRPGGIIFFCEPNILNPIVYMIKRFKYLKKIVGDSPDEWAINPLRISQQMRPLLPVSVLTGEYVIPFRWGKINTMIKVDKFFSKLFSFVPILKFLGGTVYLTFTNGNKEK